MMQQAQSLVDLENNQLGSGQSRQLPPPGEQTIKEAQTLCPECIALQQYIERFLVCNYLSG